MLSATLEAPTRSLASPIRVLPPELVARIAAGEVVERPASVLKELLENALDAGATRIAADIESGGIARVRVSDDGLGMSPDDLALAVQPHATSKLTDADQLHTLDTLGFRGEALPSIASVSRFTIISRQRPALSRQRLPSAGNSAADGVSDAATGWRIDVDGGRPEIPEPRPSASPCGTTVDARELFYNLPARQKFLKGLAAEAAACADVVLRLALTRPDVAFTLRQGRSELLNLPAVPLHSRAPRAAASRHRAANGHETGANNGHASPNIPVTAYFRRAREALGRAQAEGLVEVDFSDRAGASSIDPLLNAAASDDVDAPYRLYGLLSPPAVTRPNRAALYLTVNGRAVKDRTLTSALLEAFRHLLPPRRFPIAVLYLELPGGDVDINVHPAKAEVRFRLPSRLYALFYHAVRSACGLTATARSTEDIPEFGSPGVETRQPAPAAPSRFPARPSGPISGPISGPALRADLTFPSSGPLFASPQPARFAPVSAPPESSDFSLWPQASPPFAESVAESPQPYGDHPVTAPDLDPETFDPRNSQPLPRPAPAADFRVIGQAAGSYIIVEDESGVRLIDQHALHERILFERLLAAAKSNARADSQGLLVPETLELSAAQAALVSAGSEALDLLAHLGFDCVPFGPRAVLLRAVPAIVKTTDPARLVSELLEALAAGDETPRGGRSALARWTLREKTAYIVSCKAAIKAGERLTLEQMEALMAEFQAVAGPLGGASLTCPHGRPLALEVSWYDLEKAVGRK